MRCLSGLRSKSKITALSLSMLTNNASFRRVVLKLGQPNLEFSYLYGKALMSAILHKPSTQRNSLVILKCLPSNSCVSTKPISNLWKKFCDQRSLSVSRTEFFKIISSNGNFFVSVCKQENFMMKSFNSLPLIIVFSHFLHIR